MLVVSAHADTCFKSHRLRISGEGEVHGHLDNFVGVHAVMQAYFSGRLTSGNVRIELTYGEEEDFAGALQVRRSLKKKDMVLVVDVTGTPTRRDFVIEKCRKPELRDFLKIALKGLSYDLYSDCPDPVANEDEVDVYSEKCARVCFLGVPVTGGDYNEQTVSCRVRSIESVADAICRIAAEYDKRLRKVPGVARRGRST